MKRLPVSRSEATFQRARTVIPGGVNSPVRAFRAVGGAPFFVASAKGARIRDIDGNDYIDYVGSWGPMILGHAPAEVLEAIGRAAEKGTSYGAPTVAEVEMAELLSAAFPSLEQVRLVSSGTEACMSALRVARGFTRRDDIVKFEGCYHGHSDGLLVKAGSGAATFGVPTSPGVPADYAKHTLVLPYNDLEAIRALFKRKGKSIAAVIVEPIAGNMGVVLPAPGFLEGLREVTAQYGTLLIFDEVISGFRVCFGGAQTLYGIRPDLTCLGKIMGGGLPAAAYGGRRDIMKAVSPEGPIYQAGTLSGNPLAVAGGLAQLRKLRENPGIYSALEAKAAELTRAFRGVVVNRIGSMFTPFFTRGPVTDWDSAARADTRKFAKLHRHLRHRGIAAPPSQFEAWFVSAAHGKSELDRTAEAIRSFRA
ncbi:MAG TPA: glutamate-1-semialdehyde 2,1-aminomutase [Planctomycetota bacterium]|nr:glutamate-1-semialdehyde 2,1-aminomutase [Planctomycetota bacterium]